MHHLLTFALALLLPGISQAFSLDTTSRFWNYTTNNLASTTSKECQKAYSAEIDCSEYLLQLVNAGEERWVLDDSEPENFTQTCTATCQSSVINWIADVKDSCTESGDAAISSLDYPDGDETKNVPVETIGLIFQYKLMRACSNDENGKNCYIQQSAYLPPSFDCDWHCAMAYYWNMHEYPYSAWRIFNPWVLPFEEDDETRPGSFILYEAGVDEKSIEEGWKNAQSCNKGNTSVPLFDIGISGTSANKKVASAVSESSKTSSVASSSGMSTTSTGAATPTETSGAERNLSVTLYCSGVAVVMSIFMAIR